MLLASLAFECTFQKQMSSPSKFKGKLLTSNQESISFFLIFLLILPLNLTFVGVPQNLAENN